MLAKRDSHRHASAAVLHTITWSAKWRKLRLGAEDRSMALGYQSIKLLSRETHAHLTEADRQQTFALKRGAQDDVPAPPPGAG
jgi:hypothetical protein